MEENVSGEQAARDVNIVGAGDVAKIKRWNANPVVPVERCVHEMVQDQANAQPEVVAVCSTEVEWTYHQLNEMATRMAHRLCLLGVSPGAKVPYCFEPSPWAIVIMLSILKAGGACVVLDPKHPVHRLQSIIRDIDAALVIVSPHHTTLFRDMPTSSSSSPIKVLTFNKELLDPEPSLALSLPDVQPTDLAFVNFTSGSTGKPKGILLEHRSICTSSAYYGAAMGYNVGSRALQFSSYAFDVSISDIFFSLIRGGTVCVPTESEKLDDLAGFINRANCDTADLTPRCSSQCWSPDLVPSLKTVCLGGEAAMQKHLEVWADRVAFT